MCLRIHCNNQTHVYKERRRYILDKEELIKMIQSIQDEWILLQITRFIKNIIKEEEG